jgi:hypothetical protein
MSSHSHFFGPKLLISLALLLTFSSGCNSEFQDICTGKYDHQVTDAIAQLESFHRSLGPQAKSRALASLSLESVSLDQGDRDHWKSWAETELKRIEAYIDWANLHREESPEGERTRRRLNETANHLVAFHGYCQQGRVDRMLDTLKTLEDERKEIQTLTCRAR